MDSNMKGSKTEGIKEWKYLKMMGFKVRDSSMKAMKGSKSEWIQDWRDSNI